MAEVFWIIIASPTFIILAIVGLTCSYGKGFLNFRAKKKFSLEEREVPWKKK